MKEYMVTEDELKKYGIFDKIEKKELSFYLLLDNAIEYIEDHMEPDFTSRGKEKVADKLRDFSEYICNGENEEDWYKMVMKELGIEYKEKPKKSVKRLKLTQQEMMLFQTGIIKFHGDESPDVKSLKEIEEQAALSRAFVKGWTLSGDFTKIGKF